MNAEISGQGGKSKETAVTLYFVSMSFSFFFLKNQKLFWPKENSGITWHEVFFPGNARHQGSVEEIWWAGAGQRSLAISALRCNARQLGNMTVRPNLWKACLMYRLVRDGNFGPPALLAERVHAESAAWRIHVSGPVPSSLKTKMILDVNSVLPLLLLDGTGIESVGSLESSSINWPVKNL